MLGQKLTALNRVGVYVPGGKAAYPSSVLMNILPAKVAGVKEICMTTPCGRDGKVNPLSLRQQKKPVRTASLKSAVHRQLQPLLTEPRASESR